MKTLSGPTPRLLAASALAIALLGARVIWTGSFAYSFLVWNLALAWAPFGLSTLLERAHQRRARALLLAPIGAAWLLFLPNAPYLVTDFVHLRFRLDAPLWFDAVMLMAFAWAGMALGVASLRDVARVVRIRAGRVGAIAAPAFVAATCALTGYGIYLGRFVRLNSWDVATRPGRTLAEVFAPFAHPLRLQPAWTVTAALGMLFLVVYVTASHAPARDR